MNDEVASIEQLLDSLHVVPLACEPQATTLVPNGMPIVSLEPGSPLSSIVTRKVALPSTATGAGGSSTSRAMKELRFSILIHCFPLPGVLGSGEMIATKRRQKRREWRVGHKIKPKIVDHRPSTRTGGLFIIVLSVLLFGQIQVNFALLHPTY